MVRLQISSESPRLRALTISAVCVYLFFFVGIYRMPGSVNEWLQISRIGPTGDGHGGVLSHTQSLPTIARALGVATPEAWRMLVIAIALFAIGFSIHAINQISTRNADFCVLVTFALFSPLYRDILNGQADYDGLTLLGTALLFRQRNYAIAVLAGSLLGATNAQQSLVAIGCAAMVGLAVDRSTLPRLAVAGSSLLAVAAWVRWVLRDETIVGREDMFLGGGYLMITDWQRLIEHLPHFWAGASAITLLTVGASFRRYGVFNGVVILFGTVIVPISSFLITSDGTRIFTLVMILPSLFAISNVLTTVAKRNLLIITALATVTQGVYLGLGQDSYEPLWPTMYENLDSRPEPLD